MNTLLNRIVVDDRLLNGKPSIRGKRIAVQTILELLSSGETVENILYQYPSLENDDIRACLFFATELMSKNYSLKNVA